MRGSPGRFLSPWLDHWTNLPYSQTCVSSSSSYNTSPLTVTDIARLWSPQALTLVPSGKSAFPVSSHVLARPTPKLTPGPLFPPLLSYLSTHLLVQEERELVGLVRFGGSHTQESAWGYFYPIAQAYNTFPILPIPRESREVSPCAVCTCLPWEEGTFQHGAIPRPQLRLQP